MTLATLTDVFRPDRAVAGLVCLGWEDARAYAYAAQEVGDPVILQAGPSCRDHTPLPVLGAMFRALAAEVDVPVVAHLDHGRDAGDCRAAIEAGFTSVMFDGSALPLEENIAATRAIVEMAHAEGVSCEGEIGFVGYAEGAEKRGEPSRGSDPSEAARFAAQTGVDAMAVSVGNAHLQVQAAAELDETLLRAIEAATNAPLVIHGGSGVPHAQRARLARSSNVAKFNIGTELRQAFGNALRDAVLRDPDRFDRVRILRDTHEPVLRAAVAVLRSLRG